MISEDFTVSPGWIKYFGPVVRLTVLGLAGIALPLTGDIESELGEARILMSGLAGVPLPEGHELDDARKGDARRGGETRWR